MKVLLIHHEGAGGGSTAVGSAVAAVEARGWKVKSLARRQAAPEKIEAAAPDLVVVAGGDGTVAAVLAILPDRAVPVAIVPTGTANNIANSIGIKGEPEEIAAGWDLDRRLRFDIGRADGPWGCRRFAEGVGFGAFAESLRLSPDVDGEAKLRAGRDALRDALAEAAPLPLEFEVDGRPVSGDLLLVEVMNIALAGPRLPFAPGTDCGDGRLGIACLSAPIRERMALWLRDGAKREMPTSLIQGLEVVVRGGGATMRIDDQCCWLDPQSEVRIGLEAEPVKVLAPPARAALAG